MENIISEIEIVTDDLQNYQETSRARILISLSEKKFILCGDTFDLDRLPVYAKNLLKLANLAD